MHHLEKIEDADAKFLNGIGSAIRSAASATSNMSKAAGQSETARQA
jgi:hypothetical protein